MSLVETYTLLTSQLEQISEYCDSIQQSNQVEYLNERISILDQKKEFIKTHLNMYSDKLKAIEHLRSAPVQSTNESITSSEFESISTLVRGRITLPQVIELHFQLNKHFSTSEEPTLTLKEMDVMGFKVGKIFENKLKILRSLGFLKLDSSMQVTWMYK